MPGHRGIAGNEAADQLAKTGSSTPLTGPEPALAISEALVKLGVRRWQENEMNLRRTAALGCRQTKILVRGVNKQVSVYLCSLNRVKLKLLMGCYTGHISLNRHLHILRLTDSPTCQFCLASEEYRDQFLYECPYFDFAREQISPRLIKSQEIYSKAGAKGILKYVRATDRF